MPVDFDNLKIAFGSKSNKALKKSHFVFASMKSNALVSVGTALTKFALKSGLPVKGLIRSTLFDVFCGGETIDECVKTAIDMKQFNVGAILDYSVEGEKTEAGFDSTTEEILRTIEKAEESGNVPFGAFKVTGIGAFDLLAKIHSGETLTAEEKAAYKRVEQRVERICEKAASVNLPLLIDAEETWIQKPVDDITITMMERFNQDKAMVYYTFQMYCHSMLENLKILHKQAAEKGYVVGAKLVRGAYMEKERARAGELGYADPIQPDKASTDTDFDAGITYCLDHINEVHLFAGSHNEDSNLKLARMIKEKNLEAHDRRICFGQLYGMSDNISYNLASGGFMVAKYVPYGPIKAAIPYLIRRAKENTSVKGQSSRELTLIQREMKRRKK